MFILACVLTRHYRDYLNASILVVSDFGRLKKTVGRLQKDVVAPYAHVVHTYEQDSALDPFSARKTLLYFQGRISRKDVRLMPTSASWFVSCCRLHLHCVQLLWVVTIFSLSGVWIAKITF